VDNITLELDHSCTDDLVHITVPFVKPVVKKRKGKRGGKKKRGGKRRKRKLINNI